MNNTEYAVSQTNDQEDMIAQDIDIIAGRIKDMDNEDQEWEIERFADKIKAESLETVNFYHRILTKRHNLDNTPTNKIINKLYDRTTLLRFKLLFNE